jgi:uroporphyrinogen decarboxylase
VDFVCRATPEAIFDRSRRMLEKTDCRGYALGTGNSVPTYVPQENCFAMIAAAIR